MGFDVWDEPREEFEVSGFKSGFKPRSKCKLSCFNQKTRPALRLALRVGSGL